jgi:hypothetical protein
MGTPLIALGAISLLLFCEGQIMLDGFRPYLSGGVMTFKSSGELACAIVMASTVGLVAPMIAYVKNNMSVHARFVVPVMFVTLSCIRITMYTPDALGPLARSGISLRAIAEAGMWLGDALFLVLLIAAYLSERAEHNEKTLVEFPSRTASAPSEPRP